jgi:AcrR family transcriptional regulator
MVPMAAGLRERKKQQTRRAISDAATQLFMTNGFDNTTLGEVAEAAGVSEQTVLNYFSAKTDLFFDEEDWYGGPPQAIRQTGPAESAGAAVLHWYLADLHHRHAEGHLDRLAVYMQAIAASENLRRRRLDDLARLTAALQAALEDLTSDEHPWEAHLDAAMITSAITVAESETARLSRVLAGPDLLHAAQRAATSIFERICTVVKPPAARPKGEGA